MFNNKTGRVIQMTLIICRLGCGAAVRRSGVAGACPRFSEAAGSGPPCGRGQTSLTCLSCLPRTLPYLPLSTDHLAPVQQTQNTNVKFYGSRKKELCLFQIVHCFRHSMLVLLQIFLPILFRLNSWVLRAVINLSNHCD